MFKTRAFYLREPRAALFVACMSRAPQVPMLTKCLTERSFISDLSLELCNWYVHARSPSSLNMACYSSIAAGLQHYAAIQGCRCKPACLPDSSMDLGNRIYHDPSMGPDILQMLGRQGMFVSLLCNYELAQGARRIATPEVHVNTCYTRRNVSFLPSSNIRKCWPGTLYREGYQYSRRRKIEGDTKESGVDSAQVPSVCRPSIA